MSNFVKRYAKAIAAAVAATVYFVITDGKDSSELEEALVTLLNAAVVYSIPNDR